MAFDYLFCRDDSQRGPRVDPDFAAEAAVAGELGEVLLVDHALLARGELERALAGVEPGPPLLYRGWMLSARRYAELAAGLRAYGRELLVSPAAYRLCHHLPAAYPLLAEVTPRTVWLPVEEGLELERLAAAAACFGSAPLVLKDYVKSEKHDWEGACFIPAADDRAALARVRAGFLGWRGELLEGGLVLREFVPLRQVGVHPQSGLPLAEEYRAFVAGGEPFAWAPYWESGSYEAAATPPLDWVREVCAPIESPFFSVDLARREGGEWLVIELGDGQVAGLPPGVDLAELHRELRLRLGG